MTQLNSDQSSALKAIKEFVANESLDAFILRGGAGTGKTTLVGHLFRDLAQLGYSCALLAPTGRAGRILSNKVSQLAGQSVSGSTIHKYIYRLDRLEINEEASGPNDPGIRMIFPLRKDEPTAFVLLIDESSMLGDKKVKGDFLQFGSGRLLRDLVEFCRLGRVGKDDDRLVKLIFVGDAAQLPPVGESFSPALSAEYLASEFGLSSKECDLDFVMRQAEGSNILAQATKIRSAISDQNFNSFSLAADGQDITHADAGSAVDLISDGLSKEYSNAVIVYSNAAALDYNRSIRERLWGDANLPPQIRDVLLVNRNSISTELNNGDLVKVVWVDPRSETVMVPIKGSGVVELRFRSVKIAFRDFVGSVVTKSCLLLENLLDSPNRELAPLEQRALLVHFRNRHPELRVQSAEFRLCLKEDSYFNALQVKYGYALTCHKAQGGEWNTVVVDFTDIGGVRNASFFRWAYTAITRAAENLVVVNPPEFEAIASGMWGGYPAPPEALEDQTAQGLKSDPDWDRFSFSAATDPLFPIHLKLRVHWQDNGIRIDELLHLQYCERYRLVRGEERAQVQYFYDGKNRLSRFEIIASNTSDPGLARDVISAFEMSAENGRAEPQEQFISEFLKRLDSALEESEIKRSDVREMPYRIRVAFLDSNRKGEIDFSYNGKETWTKAQEVGGPGATGGLYEAIQRLMTASER